jgi:hypothetical protein
VQRQGNSEGGHFTDFHNDHKEEEGLQGDDFSQDPYDFDGSARWWEIRDVDVNATFGHEGRRRSDGKRRDATARS